MQAAWQLAAGFLALLALLTAVAAAGHALLYKRDPRSALGWIVTSLALPLVGPLAYFLLGINRIRTQARRLHDPRGPESATEGQPGAVLGASPEVAELIRISEAVARHPLVGGNAVEILHTGEEAYPAMLAAIAGARRRVWLATYLFDVDASGRQLIEALAAATGRGVDVAVLLDGYGEIHSRSSAGRLLADRGVSTARFLPPRLRPATWHFNLRNHRKILVVDGAAAFVGGMNIGDRNRSQLVSPSQRVIDVHFRLRGPVVAQIAQVFVEDWELAAGERKRFEERVAVAGEVACRTIIDGPNEDFDRLATLLVGAVTSARHRVTIMTPYFLPSRELIGALRTAALRGVEVTLLLPGRSNLPYVDWATRNLLWELLERGVRVVYQPPPFVHSKLFLVDEAWVLIGSFNVDPRSLRLNFEIAVEVVDAAFAGRIAEHCAAARRRSREVTLEEVDSRPLWQRVRDAFTWLFSPYL